MSSVDQSLDRQIDALRSAGVKKRNLYQDQVTGTQKDRPELNRMLSELEAGEIVIIPDLIRLSRSTKDLLEIVQQIKEKGAAIKSLKDSWLDTTTENPYNEFLLTVMSGLSQLERDLISQRTKEGLASARARGRKGGRPKIRNEKAPLVKMMADNGHTVKEIVDASGISRATVYRIIKDSKK